MSGRIDLVNKQVSKKLKIDESRVKAINEFYYKEFARQFKEAKNPYIYITGLGTFTLQFKRIYKVLIFYISRWRYYKSIKDKSEVDIKKLNAVRNEALEIFRIFRMCTRTYWSSWKNIPNPQRKLVPPNWKK